jgi:ubiquinol-cytochrome c reductase cytochrome c subunit
VVVAASLSWLFGHAGGARAEVEADAQTRADGALLWRRDCVSCHGVDATGGPGGPSLQGSGAAAVDFMVRTGRMPLEDLDRYQHPVDIDEVTSEPGHVAYTDAQIDALVAHTDTFINGPSVPDVDIAGADLARGQELFQGNCAACHAWSGRGGALTDGRAAPALVTSPPVEVVEAMRFGPGTMPRFAAEVLDADEAADVAAYVEELEHARTAGGLPLAFLGPVSEGAVAWVVGILGLVLVVRWIGGKAPR